VADRIERYLGRLETELEGRVSRDRIDEILVEVEGHLRESEASIRELGEPGALADAIALEGFDGSSGSIRSFLPRHSWRNQIVKVLGFALFFLVLTLSLAWASKAFWVWSGFVAFAAILMGMAWSKQWRAALSGNALLLLGAVLVLSAFFGGTSNTYRNISIVQRIEPNVSEWRVDGAPLDRMLRELEQAKSALAGAKADSVEAESARHWIMKLETSIGATREIQESTYVERLKVVGSWVLLFGGLFSVAFWILFMLGALMRHIIGRISGGKERRLVNG